MTRLLLEHLHHHELLVDLLLVGLQLARLLQHVLMHDALYMVLLNLKLTD